MTILKFFRKLYLKILNKSKILPICINHPEDASNLLLKKINSDLPCMIARFGAFELTAIVNYLGIKNENKSIINYIKGEEPDWVWNDSIINYLNKNAGFFPPNKTYVEQFCELMLKDSKEVDILGSWLENENYMKNYMCDEKVHLRFLEPFWSTTPWTKALKDKKVLIVHPFKNTIENQYKKRELLFENKDTLPEFKSLTVIRAVQSLGGNSEFKDWFEALEYMKNEIDKVDYDICLIGAGAYGFPLAAHVKRQGKQGLHIGGALQLFFGIIGKRWEDSDYGVAQWGIEKNFYVNLINEHWVRPDEKETPKTANNVEGGCYW
jgi:hypothetical protein